jgi:hypothetical protein
MGVNINGGLNIGSGGILISSPYIIPNDYIGPICVSGAGSTDVNGTYTFIGYVTEGIYTRPSYYKAGPANFIITLVGGRYYIQVSGGDNNGQYYGNTFPAPSNPYLETSWTIVEDGVLPFPVITAGPC